MNQVNNQLWNQDKEKKAHFEVIEQFLNYLNSETKDFILKGGTSLMMCYGLDRFSEDIDLDSTNKTIEKYIEKFCRQHEYMFRVAKDTDTTKRYMIHYSDTHRPLKIEVSYRKRHIEADKIDSINGISVYKINEIFGMKINAYNGRDKIRDLYDVVYIVRNFKQELSDERIDMLKDALSFKGLEQFDYLLKTQTDELIDNEKLAVDFLDMFDQLGLIDDYPIEEDRSIEDDFDEVDK